MVVLFARNWWTLALRGLAAILFGVAAFVWPGLTLIALTLLFGVYALLDGALALATAFITHPDGPLGWALLAEGLLGIGTGLLAFFWPGLTALAMVYLIAAWSIATGAAEIGAAIQLRKDIEGEWLLALVGLLSVGFGLALAFRPGTGTLALIWLIGAFAFGFGILLLVLAFRLRAWVQQLPTLGA